MSTHEARTACYEITANGSDGQLVRLDNGEPFDTDAYSRMKYGSLAVVQNMGAQLGEHLLATFPAQLLEEQVPEAVAVYSVVPPACEALSRYAIAAINETRTAEGLPPGKVVRIHKAMMQGPEYAAESLEVRQAILSAMPFDTLDNDFSGKTVLFMDDVRITGTTERKVCETVIEHQPANLLCGYVAQFDEAEAVSDASIESRMNSHTVKDLGDIARIMREDGFVLNIRVLKRILSPEEQPALDAFVRDVDPHYVQDIVRGAVASGLGNDPRYAPSAQTLQAGLLEAKA